jgi:4-amino-4-deoxy-L-arabinose transferase-like glycosyltransferase
MTEIDKSRSFPNYAIFIWLGGLTILRGWFAAVVELTPDEAYYFVWSTDLAMGYFDHGPLVAWLIRLGTSILGQTELAVRLGALLCSFITGWMIYLITDKLTNNRRYAFWTTVVASVCPIFAVGAVIHTPDAALAACWSVSVWFALKAFHQEKIFDWLLSGLFVGLCILAKMSGMLLVFGLGIFFIAWHASRRRLFRPGPVLAAITAALICFPNLLWNSHNSGGSFVFQWQHAFGQLSISPLNLLSFVGGQLGVVSPLLWFWLISFMTFGWLRKIRFGRSEAFMLWCSSAPVLLVCLSLSLFNKVEANWSAMAYIAALPGAAWAWNGGLWYIKKRSWWFGVTLGLAGIMSLIIHIQALFPFLPIEPGKDPTSKLRGWKDLARLAAKEAEELGVSLATEGYGPTSELIFYSGRNVIYQPSSNRISQYDLWSQTADITATDLLFLQPINKNGIPPLCRSAKEKWVLEDPPLEDSRFRWWSCRGISQPGEQEK